MYHMVIVPVCHNCLLHGTINSTGEAWTLLMPYIHICIHYKPLLVWGCHPISPVSPDALKLPNYPHSSPKITTVVDNPQVDKQSFNGSHIIITIVCKSSGSSPNHVDRCPKSLKLIHPSDMSHQECQDWFGPSSIQDLPFLTSTTPSFTIHNSCGVLLTNRDVKLVIYDIHHQLSPNKMGST